MQSNTDDALLRAVHPRWQRDRASADAIVQQVLTPLWVRDAERWSQMIHEFNTRPVPRTDDRPDEHR